MIRLDAKSAIAQFASGNGASEGTATLSAVARRVAAAPAPPTYSPSVISGIAQIVEAALLGALGFAIYGSYVGGESVAFYVALILGAVLAHNVFANMTSTHRIPAYRTALDQCGRLLAAWSMVFVLVTVAAFLFKVSDQVSRVWMVSWYASGALVLVVFRLSLRSLILSWTRDGKLRRRTVIIGGGRDAEVLIRAIDASADNDIDLVGLFDDRLDERSPDTVSGCPKLGKVADLVEFGRRTRVDLVIVSMPLSAEKRVLQMLKQLWVLPVDIRLSAHMSQLRFTRSAYSYVGEVPVFDMMDRPISDWNFVYKWMFDRFVSLVALTVLSPVMLIAAIAIKLESRGPVFFKQKRFGFNNELIEVLKFRSMYTDMSDAAAARLVTRDDPRVTRVGRLIRRTSIDELPQLINVLKGELSIVGPRPHALEAKAANTLYHEAVDGYFARHRVKPGITGWAQINGWRGETDTLDKLMQRVNHDLYYIENWTPMLDLYILVMTPISLFSSSENAY